MSPNQTAAPADLARVAVAGYGLLFGDDWYSVSVRLPAGVLARTRRVTLLDTFGQRHPIRSCAERDGPDREWRFFELTGDPGPDSAEPQERRSPWLFLPPVLAGVEPVRPRRWSSAVMRRPTWPVRPNCGWRAGPAEPSTAPPRPAPSVPHHPSRAGWPWRART